MKKFLTLLLCILHPIYTIASPIQLPEADITYKVHQVFEPLIEKSALTHFDSIILKTSLILQQTSHNYTIDWANPSGARTYHITDVGGTANFGMESGAYTAGGIAFGNGSLINFTSAGSSGQPLLSAGAGTPAFGTLGIGFGGTGQTTRQAALNALAPTSPVNGDLLYYNGTNWINLARGSDGQVLGSTSSTIAWTSAGAGDVLTTASNTYTSGSTTNDFSAVTNLVLPLEDDPSSNAGDIWVSGDASANGTKVIGYWDNQGTPAKHYLVTLDLAQAFSGVQTFANTGFRLTDTGGDNYTTLKQNSDEAADRILNIPALGADRTIAITGLANSWSTTQLPNAASTIALGSAALPFSNLFFGTAGANKEASFNTGDLTTHRVIYVPDAASTTVVPNTGAANNFLTAISAAGVVSRAQPSSSNLSDASALVYNNASNTYSTGKQDLGAATELVLPLTSDPSSNAGDMWINVGTLRFWSNSIVPLLNIVAIQNQGNTFTGTTNDFSSSTNLRLPVIADPTPAAGNKDDIFISTTTANTLKYLDNQSTPVLHSVVTLDLAQTISANKTFGNTNLLLKDTAGDNTTTLKQNSDEAGNRILNIPALGGDDTIVTLATAQAVTGIKTMSGANVIKVANTGLTLLDTAADNVTTIKQNSDEAADRILNIPALGADKTIACIDLANSWSTAQLPNAASTIALGSAALPFSNLFFSSAGANKDASFDTSALSTHRVITVPNAASTTVVADTGSTHNFLTAISAAGVISKAQPDYGDLTNAPTVNSGTSGQLAYYSASSATISGNANANISNGALTLGVNTSVAGSLKLFGGTSGSCTISVPAAAGTGTVFTLPPDNGTEGYFLTTDGSGITTWEQIDLAESVSGILPVANGGTGLATLTAHNVMLGEGTSNVAFAAPGSTTGVPLVSNNATTDPSFGTASVAGGGTGQTSLTAHYVLIGNGTTALTMLAPSATSGVALISQGSSADPAYGTINLASTSIVTGTLPMGNGGTGQTSFTAHGVLVGAGASALAVTGTGTLGQVLTSNGSSSDPTFAAVVTFGGSGSDGSSSNPSAFTAPIQKNFTTFSLTGANTLTLTNSPTIINCTSTFTLGDSSNASTITNTAGGGSAGGAGAVHNTTIALPGSNGGGPGGGVDTQYDAATGGSGGGFGAAGGAGGSGTASRGARAPGGGSYNIWRDGGSGGAGGGSSTAADGVAGGNGGGSIIVCAVGAISCTTISVINCKGAAGTATSTASVGAGGAGSGGLVLLASQASVTVAGTIDVTGGAGGNDTGATAGGGGGGGGGGRIVLWSPTNTTTGSTLTLAGGAAGTSTNGSAGIIGATATSQAITGTPNSPLLAYMIKDPKGGQYLDTLCRTEAALGHVKNNVVNINQNDWAWTAAGNDISKFAYFNMGNMEGTTCLGVGNYVEENNIS